VYNESLKPLFFWLLSRWTHLVYRWRRLQTSHQEHSSWSVCRQCELYCMNYVGQLVSCGLQLPVPSTQDVFSKRGQYVHFQQALTGHSSSIFFHLLVGIQKRSHLRNPSCWRTFSPFQIKNNWQEWVALMGCLITTPNIIVVYAL